MTEKETRRLRRQGWRQKNLPQKGGEKNERPDEAHQPLDRKDQSG
ncbi:MAG: hypothetical protein WHU95_07200 [candidate division WOR-3 bacterium]|nr:hypothetical protein [candidate division WOR-3 bacterium]MDH7519461.1 hypothetical protein [bacterium]